MDFYRIDEEYNRYLQRYEKETKISMQRRPCRFGFPKTFDFIVQHDYTIGRRKPRKTEICEEAACDYHIL